MYDGPAIAGLTGFGDVGAATLHFDPPLTVYAVLRNGLISASRIRTRTGYGEGGEEYCSEADYSFAGLDANDSIRGLDFGDEPAKGFPEAGPGSNPYVMFVTTRAMTPRRVQVTTRTAKAPARDDPNGATLPLALHEVDLDRDGVADILVWETTSVGELSEGPVFARSYYVNIAGRWYAAGDYAQQECT